MSKHYVRWKENKLRSMNDILDANLQQKETRSMSSSSLSSFRHSLGLRLLYLLNLQKSKRKR